MKKIIKAPKKATQSTPSKRLISLSRAKRGERLVPSAPSTARTKNKIENKTPKAVQSSPFRAYLPLVILLLLGYATGAGMIYLGLTARIAGAIPEGDLSSWFGVSFIEGFGLSVSRTGWGLVLLGIFWFSALSALWAGSRWGWWSTLLAAIGSVIFFPGGLVTAILVLSLLLLTSLRERSGLAAAKEPGK